VTDTPDFVVVAISFPALGTPLVVTKGVAPVIEQVPVFTLFALQEIFTESPDFTRIGLAVIYALGTSTVTVTV
jgi:hypothetical protein